MRKIETVIVGSGQAGLATSYHLGRLGLEHVILERSDKPASSWRGRSWDSFCLVTPNSFFRMPGAELNHLDRNAFLDRSEVIGFFDAYAKKHSLPVEYQTLVTSIEQSDRNTYIVRTDEVTWEATNVVIATGFFQKPGIPEIAGKLSREIRQLHSSEYRNPASLPPGSVLVVGSGQSGTQIAEELHHHGRQVFLSVGKAGRAPRRYRGKDIIEWLELVGLFDLTPEQLPPGMGKFDAIPHLSGSNGGHTINLHQFARDGITLLGHVRDIRVTTITIAQDLKDSLILADRFESEATTMIDSYITENNLDVPMESLPQLTDGFEQSMIKDLDLKKEGISTVIWATGYNFDYHMVKLPVLDQDGFPIQTSGITDYRGLYFVGIPWMPSERSGSLIGVAEAARMIAQSIEQTSRKTPKVVVGR
jgi:putative flavoprotein involved in K+ transport